MKRQAFLTIQAKLTLAIKLIIILLLFGRATIWRIPRGRVARGGNFEVPKRCYIQIYPTIVFFLCWGKAIRAWTNDKCLATKHHQTLFGDQTFYRLDTLFVAVCSCLIVFDSVWSCLIKFEGRQTFKQQLKTFLLFSCLMGDVLFV